MSMVEKGHGLEIDEMFLPLVSTIQYPFYI
jgi:hypothetical protein